MRDDASDPESAPPVRGGLYIHVPFCLKKCRYCDFFSITDPSLIDPFINALIGELQLRKTTRPTFDSIYIGGGTPSMLHARQVERILRSVHRSFAVSAEAPRVVQVADGIQYS